jgi:hypothetical protein
VDAGMTKSLEHRVSCRELTFVFVQPSSFFHRISGALKNLDTQPAGYRITPRCEILAGNS